MNKNKYNISTLNPELLVDRRKKIKVNGNIELGFELDFRMGQLDESQVVMVTDSYNECALFKQLEYVMNDGKSQTSEKFDEDLLATDIFYLDFSKLFMYKKELTEELSYDDFLKSVPESMANGTLTYNHLFHYLFKNGFSVKYDNCTKHYVAFDGSASMLRNAKISFINEELKAKVNERLLLGMDLTLGKKNKAEHITVYANKYFAYRGLYLSDGYRIENNDRLLFDADKVIVIDDANHKLQEKNQDLLIDSVFVKEVDASTGLLKFAAEKKKVSLNSFDGEGIISFEYADEINNQLYEGKASASSFQVRMPFVKGMLHKVDFKKFFVEEAGLDFGEPFMVTDIFGIERDLRKAEIILTKSMLKNNDWFKAYFDENEQVRDVDPMVYYFDKYAFYNHSLYTLKTDLNLHNDNEEVRLNYQSLNTLCLSREKFLKVVNGRVEKLKEIQKDPEALRELVLGDTATAGSAWKYALSQNLNALKDEAIKDNVKAIIDSRTKEIYRGNIRVEGENRYLSGDLLAFLVHVLKQETSLKKASKEQGKDKDSLKYPKLGETIATFIHKGISRNDFRAPGSKFEANADKLFGFLRNPHLSRNEDCVLYSSKDSEIYSKYFNHLSGVVMIGYESLAAARLGGADYDGDMVKIIKDRAIVDAMVKSQKACPALVDIPSSKVDKVPVPEAMNFKMVRDTFGNQIGSVSNLAIALGGIVYGGGQPVIGENGTEYTPEMCTLLTGCEIDAAKTGKHPRANIEELREALKEKRSNYIFEKDFLDDLADEDVRKIPTKKGINEGGENYSLYYKDATGKEALAEFSKYEKDPKNIPANVPNIDLLPGIYLETYYAKDYCKDMKKSIDMLDQSPIFKFDEDNWTKDDEEKSVKAVAYVSAYSSVTRKYGSLKRNDEKRKSQMWFSKAMVLIKKQNVAYGTVDNAEMQLNEFRSMLVNFINSNESGAEYGFTISDRVDTLIARIVDNEWIYTIPENRVEVLKEIFPESEFADLYEKTELVDMLCNFSSSGFMIPYYVLMDIGTSGMNMSDELKKSPLYEKLRSESEANAEIYNKAYKKAQKAFERKLAYATKKKMSYGALKKMLVKTLLNDIIDGNVLDYAVFFYVNNPQLFWDMFDGKDGLLALKKSGLIIENNVYDKWYQIEAREVAGEANDEEEIDYA